MIVKIKALIMLIFAKNYLLITIPKTGRTTQFYDIDKDKFDKLAESMSVFGKMMLDKLKEGKDD